MSYFYLFLFCLLYFLTSDSIQINVGLASELSESKFTSNVDEENPQPAKLNLAKYVVSIRHRNQFNYRYNQYFGSTHFCGGTILSPQLILTVAHCLVRNGRRIRRSALEVVTSTPVRLVQTAHSQIIEVSQVTVHSKYDAHRFRFDIGLLRLNSKIDLDGVYAQALPLPRVPSVAGANCTMLGWSRLYMDGPYANEISYLNLTIRSTSNCRIFFSLFTDRNICASDPNYTDRTICSGDSGGPLICKGSVTGLVSHGFLCSSGSPMVFTDVYEYLDWIKKSKSGKLGSSLWMLRLLSLLLTTKFSR